MTNPVQAQLSFSKAQTPNESPAPIPARRSTLERFNERLSLLRLPSKGVSTLLGWGELLPFNHDLHHHLSEQRTTLKTMNSTFALPKFFTKQIKFSKALVHLKKDLSENCDLGQLTQDVKKVFFSALGLLLSSLKMPLLLHKTQIIDLTEISRQFPDLLEKGEGVLSFGGAVLHFADGLWTLRACVKDHKLEDQRPPDAAKLNIKLISSTIKVSLGFIEIATLFFGCCLSPVILITVSTISFATSLIKKMVHHKPLSFKEQFFYKAHSLPV